MTVKFTHFGMPLFDLPLSKHYKENIYARSLILTSKRTVTLKLISIKVKILKCWSTAKASQELYVI